MNAARLYLAELLGTFLFLTIGYASVPNFGAATPAIPSLLVVPFSFSFGLLAAIYAFGHISGGHYNPAVTIAMVVDRRNTPIEAVGYIIAQIIGAIGAAAVIRITISQTDAARMTAAAIHSADDKRGGATQPRAAAPASIPARIRSCSRTTTAAAT